MYVENDGNVKASDIRIEVEIPNWLLAFNRLPEESDTPKKPQKPKPVRPKFQIISSSHAYGEIINKSPKFDFSSLNYNKNSKSGCYLKQNSIHFWADNLLHKHTLTHAKDRFYVMALENAPKGRSVLKGRSFCSEYENWEEFELVVNVT